MEASKLRSNAFILPVCSPKHVCEGLLHPFCLLAKDGPYALGTRHDNKVPSCGHGKDWVCEISPTQIALFHAVMTYRLVEALELIKVSNRDEIRIIGWWPCRTPPSVQPLLGPQHWTMRPTALLQGGAVSSFPCNPLGRRHCLCRIGKVRFCSPPRRYAVRLSPLPGVGRDARSACGRAEVPRLPWFDPLATVSCAQGHRNNCAETGI